MDERQQKLQLAKRKLNKFQQKKKSHQPSIQDTLQETPETLQETIKLTQEPQDSRQSVLDSLVDSYQTPDSNSEPWIDGWLSKVNNLLTKVPLDKNPTQSPENSNPNALEPVLQRMGLSSEILSYISSLDNTTPIEQDISPIQIPELIIPPIPTFDPTRETDLFIKAWQAKVTVLEQALNKSRSDYLKEITGRKNLENQVASITSRIAIALERMANEKSFALREMSESKKLLEEGMKEKINQRNQIQELIKQKETLQVRNLELQNSLDKAQSANSSNEISKEVLKFKQEAESFKIEIQAREKDVRAQKENLEKLDKELSRRKLELDTQELKSESDRVSQEEIVHLKSKLLAFENDLFRLNGETNQSKRKLNEITQEKESIKSQLEKSLSEKASLIMSLEILQDENRKLELAKSQMSALALSNMQHTYVIDDKEKIEYENTITDLKSKLKSATESLNTDKEANLKTLEHLRKELEQEKQKVHDSQMEKRLNESLLVDQSFLDERQQKISALTEELLERQKLFENEKTQFEQDKKHFIFEKEKVANQHANILERESYLRKQTGEINDFERMFSIEQKEKKLQTQQTILDEKLNLLDEKERILKAETDAFLKQKIIIEEQISLAHEESKKVHIALNTIADRPRAASRAEGEYAIRQKELDDSLKAFNAFKNQFEVSILQREARLNQEFQKFEEEKANFNYSHLNYKNELEAEIKTQKDLINTLQTEISQYKQTVEKQTSLINRTRFEIDSKNISLAEELGRLSLEKSKVEELKTRNQAEATEIEQDRQRLEEAASTLEHEWVVVKLKEAEVTKALADISVAAAQQAVGSSITTTETIISRDRIRELENHCQQLFASNDLLKSKVLELTKDKIMAPVQSLVESPKKPLPFISNEKKTNVELITNHMNNLDKTNLDLKSKIEILISQQQLNSTAVAPMFDESISSLNSRPIPPKKPKKMIADPRSIKSSLGHNENRTFSPISSSNAQINSRNPVYKGYESGWNNITTHNTINESLPSPIHTGHTLNNPLLGLNDINSHHNSYMARSEMNRMTPSIDNGYGRASRTSDFRMSSSPYQKSEIAETMQDVDSMVASRISNLKECFEAKDLQKFSEPTRSMIMKSRESTTRGEKASQVTSGAIDGTMDKDQIRELVRQRLKEKGKKQ